MLRDPWEKLAAFVGLTTGIYVVVWASDKAANYWHRLTQRKDPDAE